jgi:hypothetical protein
MNGQLRLNKSQDNNGRKSLQSIKNKMKQLLILAIVPTIFTASYAQAQSDSHMDKATKPVTFMESEGLVGNIKTLEETPFKSDENGNAQEMEECCKRLIEVNKDGHVVKVTEKNSDGSIDMVSVYALNASGKSFLTTITEDDKTRTRERKFDANGHAILGTWRDHNGNITDFHTVDLRNEFGQALSGRSYHANGEYMGRWSRQRVDKVRLGESWTNSSGVKVFSHIGEANEKGWLSKLTDVHIDEEGNKTTEIETFTYDKFDDVGNWTQRTKVRGGIAVEVMKRQYTYY